MSNPNNIILAVIPANVDVATAEVLERARVVDPEGERTVGVLTKADLVQAEGYEEVCRVIRNETKPLTLGYYLVNSKVRQEEEREATDEKIITIITPLTNLTICPFAQLKLSAGLLHLNLRLRVNLLHHPPLLLPPPPPLYIPDIPIGDAH